MQNFLDPSKQIEATRALLESPLLSSTEGEVATVRLCCCGTRGRQERKHTEVYRTYLLGLLRFVVFSSFIVSCAPFVTFSTSYLSFYSFLPFFLVFSSFIVSCAPFLSSSSTSSYLSFYSLLPIFSLLILYRLLFHLSYFLLPLLYLLIFRIIPFFHFCRLLSFSLSFLLFSSYPSSYSYPSSSLIHPSYLLLTTTTSSYLSYYSLLTLLLTIILLRIPFLYIPVPVILLFHLQSKNYQLLY